MLPSSFLLIPSTMFFSECLLQSKCKKQMESFISLGVPDVHLIVPPTNKRTIYLPVDITDIDLIVPPCVHDDGIDSPTLTSQYSQSSQDQTHSSLKYNDNSYFEENNDGFEPTYSPVSIFDTTPIKKNTTRTNLPTLPDLVGKNLMTATSSSQHLRQNAETSSRDQHTNPHMSPIIFAPNVKATLIVVQHRTDKDLSRCWIPPFSRFCRHVEEIPIFRSYNPIFRDQIIMSQGNQFHRDRGMWFLAVEPEEDENKSIISFDDSNCLSSYGSHDSADSYDSAHLLPLLLGGSGNKKLE